MTNLDQQIRDILSRSYPVNDNRPLADTAVSKPLNHNGGISVVGNHNIIISAELFVLETVLLAGFCIFLLGR